MFPLRGEEEAVGGAGQHKRLVHTGKGLLLSSAHLCF